VEGIMGDTPRPHQRGSASLDSPLFTMGIPQGALPLWQGIGDAPQLPPNSPQDWGIKGVERTIFIRRTQPDSHDIIPVVSVVEKLWKNLLAALLGWA